jgi:BTB/POZ domain/WD domain, G-beta repeat
MNKHKIIEMEAVMVEIANAKEKIENVIKHWMSVIDAMDRRAKKYEKLLRDMKNVEEVDKRKRYGVDTVMKLNVRGQVFDTTKDILVNFDGTYFTRLLSSPFFELDEAGEFFIDRNSHCFDRIVEYMRTGELCTEGLNSYDKGCLYDNLIYLKIPYKARLTDSSVVTHIENIELGKLFQLNDGRLCGSTNDNNICVIQMHNNTIDTTMNGHTDSINAIIQLNDGRLCSCSNDNTIKIWKIEYGKCDLTLVGHTDRVTCVAQLMDGRICSGSLDHMIKIWNKNTGKCIQTIDTFTTVACVLALSNGGICSGGHIGNVYIFSKNGEWMEILHRSGYGNPIAAVIAIDESRICSCSADQTMKIWKVATGVCERTLEGHAGRVRDMVLLLDGSLCSTSEDGSVKIWNVETGVCEASIQVNTTGLDHVVQLHDGRLVASKSNEVVYAID